MNTAVGFQHKKHSVQMAVFRTAAVQQKEGGSDEHRKEDTRQMGHMRRLTQKVSTRDLLLSKHHCIGLSVCLGNGGTMTHDEIYEGRVARDKRNYPFIAHDELLETLNSANFKESRTLDTPYAVLRAVANLHKPVTAHDGLVVCDANCEFTYPCPTIMVIERQLGL